MRLHFKPWVLKIGRNKNPPSPAVYVLDLISVLWMTAGDNDTVYAMPIEAPIIVEGKRIRKQGRKKENRRKEDSNVEHFPSRDILAKRIAETLWKEESKRGVRKNKNNDVLSNCMIPDCKMEYY